MKPGFTDRYCETLNQGDFRNFRFLKAKEFVDIDGTRYQIPANAPTDLASTPREIWDVLPPFGEYALESALHDCAYQNTLLKWDGAQWVKANLTKDQCDELYRTALGLNAAISRADAKTLYEGVHLCGWRAYKEDRGN